MLSICIHSNQINIQRFFPGYSFNYTAAATTDINQWNNTAPTSTVFTVGTDQGVNGNSEAMVAYCFHSTDILKVGSFAANASADGTWVNTGFKVRSIPFLKRIDSTSNWFDLDTARDTYNPMSAQLYPNLASAETSAVTLDACSQGFKLRTASAPNDGGTYIYLTIADICGKFS